MSGHTNSGTRQNAASGAARPRVAIVGGGVCGLGIGWRLAQAGCPVEVFERGEAGREASWAAAGMLAGGVETEPGEEPLLVLARESQRRWPEFAGELTATTGIDLGYRDEGTLIVAVTRDEAEQLRFTYDFQRGLGIELQWLTGAEVRRREPHLRAGIAAGVYSPGDHQVDNRALVLALRAAFLSAGGRLHEGTEVTALEVESGRARGLRCGDARHEADVVVVAAGAWSRALPGLPGAARPPVRPVKGQMLALQMDPAAPLLRHVLWATKSYLTPRRDGRLIVGATVEERGFDARLTAGGVFALLEAAWRPLPAIEELPIVEFWTGFRPTSRDDQPILGPTPVDGLVLATGHHRNGILLAPVTADLVAEFVLRGRLDPAAAPFTLERFAETPTSALAGGAA
jgi:glycine oxidase